MSCGVVVCSACRREVHQDGPRPGDNPLAPRSWTHCEDKTPRCEGATSDYAAKGEPKGAFCGADAC